MAAALAQRKTLRILAMGAAPGRVSAHGGAYTALIEAMLEHALKGIDVVMINRGVSGELAASAAIRMKNEVALDEPDLVLWQVGTNDALAYVPADEFAATVKDQIDWLKAHKVDVVLVGLQFAKEMLRDAHYIDIRETLRRVAAQENVIVIRFFEAMQIINQAQRAGPSRWRKNSSATRPATIAWRNTWRAPSRSACSPRTCRSGRRRDAAPDRARLRRLGDRAAGKIVDDDRRIEIDDLRRVAVELGDALAPFAAVDFFRRRLASPTGRRRRPCARPPSADSTCGSAPADSGISARSDSNMRVASCSETGAGS